MRDGDADRVFDLSVDHKPESAAEIERIDRHYKALLGQDSWMTREEADVMEMQDGDAGEIGGDRACSTSCDSSERRPSGLRGHGRLGEIGGRSQRDHGEICRDWHEVTARSRRDRARSGRDRACG